MARTLFLTVFLFLLFSCGVKVMPVAPDRPHDRPAPRLNCSPQDPTCDATDPNYKPLGFPTAPATSDAP